MVLPHPARVNVFWAGGRGPNVVRPTWAWVSVLQRGAAFETTSAKVLEVTPSMPHPILLYDGVCGLCNRLVQFILRRDPEGVFRFAALQSALAGRVLARHGLRADDLDTVYVVVDYETPGERLLGQSEAVILILRQLGGGLRPAGQPGAGISTQAPGLAIWRFIGFLLQLVPRRLRDWAYRLVARSRYRIFGRYDACPIPTAETRARFLDE